MCFAHNLPGLRYYSTASRRRRRRRRRRRPCRLSDVGEEKEKGTVDGR